MSWYRLYPTPETLVQMLVSDTPLTDDEESRYDHSIIPHERHHSVEADFAREMERLLRDLRASANCYVSPEKLKEVDDFLNQK